MPAYQLRSYGWSAKLPLSILCDFEEFAVYDCRVGETLPRRRVRELAAEAATVYSHSERFRRRVRGSEARGRDYLWMFMRHWLAAKIHERNPELYARLPGAYSVGSDLPLPGVGKFKNVN